MIRIGQKLILRVLLLLVVGGFIYALLRPAGGGLSAGDTAPDFQLSGLDGPTLQLSAYRGRVVVVNFWATWCPPCVEEMPSLNRFTERFGPKGVAVLAVSVDEDEQALRSFAAKYQLKMAILRDPGRKVSASYHTFQYPETYILDRQGRLVQKVIGGYDWDSPQLASFFEGLLNR